MSKHQSQGMACNDRQVSFDARWMIAAQANVPCLQEVLKYVAASRNAILNETEVAYRSSTSWTVASSRICFRPC